MLRSGPTDATQEKQAHAPREFPVGGGEMGELIRNFDWSKTSLGPISGWPQSLRTATDIVLQSPLPLVMLWGPDGVMIYNDAYSVFAGQRHPRLLGSKVLEGWAEVADFNARVMEVGLAGGTLSFKDQELTLYRNNVPEQVWMDLNYGPVLDESGRPAGVLAIVVETTGKAQAERRLKLISELGDRLRALADPPAVMAAASELLGRHLGAVRVGYAELEADDVHTRIENDWRAEGVSSVAGRHHLLSYGPEFAAEYRAGRAVVIDDFAADPRSSGSAAAAHAALGVQAQIAVPLIKAGRLAALLFVHSSEPRRWQEAEVALVREVAERTWSAIERVRAEDALRVRGEEFYALADNIPLLCWMAYADGHIFWYNRRWYDYTGTSPESQEGWGWESVHDPAVLPSVVERWRHSLDTGEPFEMVFPLKGADGVFRPFLTRIVPIRNDDGEIVRWFGSNVDITDQKRSEEHLQLLIHELNHRVKNTLATVQSLAMQTFKSDMSDGRGAERLGAFESRLISLSKAHDVLTRENWESASLQAIVREAVAPHCGAEETLIEVSGPDRRISPKLALALSMALHELCTNAAKYGALSEAGGRVVLDWIIEIAQSEERLRLQWKELDGPPVRPPEQKGFGTRLLERQLARELRGRAELDYAPQGLICTIEAPLGAAPRKAAQGPDQGASVA